MGRLPISVVLRSAARISKPVAAWLLAASCGWVASAASAPLDIPIPPAREILRTLHAGHPRLLAGPEDFQKLKQRTAADPRLEAWRGLLLLNAGNVISAPPSKYEIPDGLRLLSTSRRVVDRMLTLGMAWQLTGERRYPERAWKELTAAADFPDWNPRHFLDTAEMTYGFAIGYDWMFDAWTPEQRRILRAAMIEKGLKPALNVYRGQPKPSSSWNKARHNWNQVCNGGIGVGALALADEEPALAGELLSAGLNSIQLPMREFAPDGAWAEGPGYWNYATAYNVALLAALESALGTDFGLGQIPGFAECGTFPIYATGPLGRTFNYADAGDGTIRAPHLFWLARKFQQPDYAAYQRNVLREGSPLDLLWYDAALAGAKPSLALDKYFRNAEVVTMRSAWNDSNALFLGCKAGDNKANHSNLDLGSFVLDANGVRWFVDLGADDYNLPGYFGSGRWNFYRMRAEGHNTLVLNPTNQPDQNPRAATKMVRFDSKSDRAFAVADLTPAYKGAGAVRRGFAMLGRRQVLVQDEVTCPQPAEAWWFAHTPAQIKLSADGRLATLSKDGKEFVAEILAPADARFQVMDAVPLPSSPQLPKQNPNRGVRKLAIHVGNTKELRLAVLFRPVRTGGPGSPVPIVALDKW